MGEVRCRLQPGRRDTIALFTPREAERHILHEFTHAGHAEGHRSGRTASAGNEPPVRARRASGKLDGMYGMTNLDEFVATAFTQSRVSRALMKVLALVDYTVKTAWDACRALRGKDCRSETPALQSALDKAMVLGGRN